MIRRFGIPLIVKGLEKSTSFVNSKTLPAPETCEPAFIIGAYDTSNVSPKTGSVTLKSTIVALALLPGIFKPKVLAIESIDFLSCA